MDAHADRARSFALICIGVAALILAVAALLFAVSWRQHYGNCPQMNQHTSNFSRTCILVEP